jgi:colanic acid/amylovoran biosynthesis glycosyltransferase
MESRHARCAGRARRGGCHHGVLVQSGAERLEPDAEQVRDPLGPVRLAYLVARFPKITETFVVRELNAVNGYHEIDAELFALFRPESAMVHASAAPWLEGVHRPTLAAAAQSLIRWSLRRPLKVATTAARLGWGFRRHPRLLLASFGSMLMACAHAETMVRLRTEHVHAHFAGNTATAAWVIRRLTGISYSITAHAYDLFQDQDFLLPRLRDARFVITISRFNAEFLADFCQGVAPPIYVVRAGVDLKRFRYLERRLRSDGPVRALCVASLLPHKGHGVLLDALASDDDPQLRRINLDIVGDGVQRPALEEQIRQLKLGGRVRLHGSLAENEVAGMFDRADLFVLPSVIAESGRMEGVPVVLMEALACGVPAVASRLSGVPELVEDGVTGTLAEQGDVESLRQCLRRVLDDPARAVEMARAGRLRVVAEYDVSASAAELRDRFVGVTRRMDRQRQRPRRRHGGPAFIAWSRSARSQELAEAAGADVHVVYFTSLVRPVLVPLRYVLSAVATMWFLARQRPGVVVATNPPIFPALIAYLFGRSTGARLILDSHPRGFGHKGSRMGAFMAPVHRYLVRRAHATLVAGPELARTVERWGGRAVVLHEAPPLWLIDRPPLQHQTPTIMWVGIYAPDEPVAEVVEAARLLPDCHFLITGDVRRCPVGLLASAPPNVEFTGYWAHEHFQTLIEQSDVMLVLTTEKTSVPRAAFEAVEALRPLVLSDWQYLRELFPDAVFVDNAPAGVAAGVSEAVARHAELVAVARNARDAQHARWRDQLQALSQLIDSAT